MPSHLLRVSLRICEMAPWVMWSVITLWIWWIQQGPGACGLWPQTPRWIPGVLFTGHRLEDNPGVRRHLVKKPSRIQGGRGSPSGLAPILRRKKKKKKLDRRPHEVVLRVLPFGIRFPSGDSPNPGSLWVLTLISAAGVRGVERADVGP